MRIAYLRIEGFRGLSLEEDLDVDVNTLILSGPNGSGKTTIIDAVHILLSKPRVGIERSIATAVTKEEAILEINVKLDQQDIAYIAETIYNPNDGVELHELRREIENKYFSKGEFKRKLEINKYSLGWENSSSIIEEINGTKIDERTDPALNEILRCLCFRIDRLENLSIGPILNINTSFKMAEVINTQGESDNSRNVKTNIGLTQVFSAQVNKLIATTSKEMGGDLEQQIIEVTNYYNSVLEPYSLVMDRNEFKRTQTILLQFVDPTGNTYPIEKASSGQKQVIALLTLLRCWSESKGRPVLLFDEPDIGMHPDMIGKFAKVFQRETESLANATCIISTHSPDLIKSHPKDVFSLLRDNNKVSLQRVETLKDRVTILRQLGLNFDLSYMIEKIIFVESVVGKKSGLSDEEIYQRIIDPYRKRVIFKSGPHNLGGKEDLGPRKAVFDSVMEALVSDKNFEVWTLQDRDTSSFEYNPPTKITTPYRNVEYYFICYPAYIHEVLNDHFNISLTEEKIREVFFDDETAADDLLQIDAKKNWGKLLHRLKVDNSFDEENIEILESELIKKHAADNLKNLHQDVREFIKNIQELKVKL